MIAMPFLRGHSLDGDGLILHPSLQQELLLWQFLVSYFLFFHNIFYFFIIFLKILIVAMASRAVREKLPPTVCYY
jgi:hypothetical protein